MKNELIGFLCSTHPGVYFCKTSGGLKRIKFLISLIWLKSAKGFKSSVGKERKGMHAHKQGIVA